MAQRIDADDAMHDADRRRTRAARRQMHIGADSVSASDVRAGLISAAIDAAECRGIASPLSADEPRYDGA
jgi:hypothetical protein